MTDVREGAQTPAEPVAEPAAAADEDAPKDKADADDAPAAEPEADGKGDAVSTSKSGREAAAGDGAERSGQKPIDQLRQQGDQLRRQGADLIASGRKSLGRAGASAREWIAASRQRLGPQLERAKTGLAALGPWLARQAERVRGLEPHVRRAGVWLRAQAVRAAEGLRGLEPHLRRAGVWLREKATWSAERLRALGVAAIALVRERAIPATIEAGHRLRERVRPQVLKQDYRRFQIFVHRTVFDRSVERVLFIPSKNHIPLSQLSIRSLTRLSGRDYRPTPRLVAEWALDALPEPVKRFAFVDFGAGVGRVLLLASHREFDKIRGVEFAQELYDDCLMNIAQYPRSHMKCRDVACVHDDATLFDLPEQNCVLYFFNPFGETVLREVMARVARSFDRNPRRLYVIAVDLPSTAAIDEWRIFERVRIDRNVELKLQLFSPYSVAVFRSTG